MRGSEIWESAGSACSYWATARDLERVQPEKLVPAAREVVKLYPDTDGASYIREALRDDDVSVLGGEEIDMIVQVHLFGEVVYG